MAKKQMTLVYYHVPEDKDDLDCPNVFGVPQSVANIKLSHIHQTFPLKGSYLFRFKVAHQGSVVWLDLPDVQSRIPLFKERVVMKATRVSWQQSKLHSQYRQKPSKMIQSSPSADNIDFFEANRSNGKQSQSKQKKQVKQINLMEHSPSANRQPPPPPQTSPGFNLLYDGHQNSQEQNSQEQKKKKEEVNLLHSFDGDLLL